MNQELNKNTPGTGRALPGLLARHRFLCLFATLLSFFVFVPVLHEIRGVVPPEFPHFLLVSIFALALSVVVVSIGPSKRWQVFTVALSLLAGAIWLLPPNMPLHLVRYVVGTIYLVNGIITILRRIFTTRQVTLDLLCASLCVYLLLGFVWAMAYSLMELLNPGAFLVPAGTSPSAMEMDSGTSAAPLYFSFATLTTLGYGDIVPVSAVTRMLAVLEAIVGQLYLTVLVARLVSLHIVEAQGNGQQ